MTQYFGQFDSEGRPLGFYADDIHETMPGDVVPISEEQWQEMLANPGRCTFIDGAVVRAPEAKPGPVEEPMRNAFDEIDALTLRVEALEAKV